MDRANAKEEGRRLAAERKRRAKEELEVSSTIARLDAIFEKLLHVGGLECEGVFRISPQEGVVPKLLKKVLATNRTDRLVRILKDLTEPHTVASLFKAVLGSRDVPLIPFELNPEWDQLAALSLGGPGRATESLAVAVLDFVVRVPEPHQQLLRRLIQMLQQVDRSSSEPTGSRMGAAALGVVFAPMVRRRDTFHDAGTDIGQQTKADAAALGSVISLLGDPLASLESVAKDPDWVAKAVAADEELARQHLSYGPTDRQQHDALPFEDSNAAVERWNAAEREAAWAAKHIEADLVDVSRRSSSSLATNEAELLWSSRNSSPNHQHPGADVSNVQSDQTTQQSQPRQSTHQLLLAASEAAGRHYGLSPGAALVAQRSTIEHATTRVQQLQQVLIQSTELTKQRLELRWRLQNAALDRDHAAQGLQSVDLDLTRAATAGADHQRWLRELQNTVSNRRRAASSKAADVRRLQEANAALLEDLRALATQDPTDLEEFQKRELKALQEERDAVYIELNRQKECAYFPLHQPSDETTLHLIFFCRSH
eukprot:SAG31_NODE_453_length_15464_cov_37.074064_19_plen_541_part_00